MDRELLIEIGTEEIPASWLPGLTKELGARVEARLKELRLAPAAPIEAYSTPRRLTVCVGRLAERQTDLEEVVTGPPASAAVGADGRPTPAAAGFAKKHGVEPEQLERLETPKGTYLAVRKQQRGRAAVDVLPDVLSGVLRDMAFPRLMRWDATLDDGRGELSFGRPIRWILFLYGGRVVPFTIFRTGLAQGPLVQEIRSGAVTFGHRFLTTSGRAGRAIKVKSFDDYKKRLAENFVVLERSERHDRIARELEIEASRRGGRVATALVGQTLLQEVPDLVEYPTVVSGAFADEFLSLPHEVLTTTMIHHQHFFPVVNEQRLLPVFLAVLNTAPEKPELIVRNLERVLTARLRDARFFYEADRRQPLESRVDRLETVLFHKSAGSYLDKAQRVEELARWICASAFGKPELGEHAATAGRLCKADLATEMVRELTELQGTIGGIYAREDGLPELVWKAIYYHYLPVGVEERAAPSREDLGTAAVTWAAVSLADKLDTVVSLFAAGERPTGSRDPLGIRRAMNGVMKILMDLRALTGLEVAPKLGQLIRKATERFGVLRDFGQDGNAVAFTLFVRERFSAALELRGFDKRSIRAVVQSKEWEHLSPEHAVRLLRVLPDFTSTPEFGRLAMAFKRIRNLAVNLSTADFEDAELVEPHLENLLKEPAEQALLEELGNREPVIEGATKIGDGYRRALSEAAALADPVDRFFTDVLVMTEDEQLRKARLRLLKKLEGVILKIADISEVAPTAEEKES